MHDEAPLIRTVSDTALWTAAYRAEESRKARPLFEDPLSEILAGERGREMARRVKHPAVRLGVVLRTAIIDKVLLASVAENGCDCVVNIAAGMDTRPYRLGLAPGLRWIEVDLPGILEHKAALLVDETPRCRLERVALDVTDAVAMGKLLRRVGEGSMKVVVLTEGLLGYLRPEEVAALAAEFAKEPSVVEWITDLMGPGVAPRVKNAGDELKGDGSRIVFAPDEGTAFFERSGWHESAYHGFLQEGRALGRETVVSAAIRLLIRAAPRATRTRLERGIGVVRLSKSRRPMSGVRRHSS